jgi:hypothetical protein
MTRAALYARYRSEGQLGVSNGDPSDRALSPKLVHLLEG